MQRIYQIITTVDGENKNIEYLNQRYIFNYRRYTLQLETDKLGEYKKLVVNSNTKSIQKIYY